MKTLIIALATSAALISGAHAANTSFSTGDGFDRSNHVVDQTLFGGAVLDVEPTASIGGVVAAGNQVLTGRERINGREFSIRYTLNADGSKNIVSKSATSSSN